ncbi:uncharacterized protein LOC133205769 isoform X2 [Saccostrea echinata]|uniref:uncharacterized protein LOC133205769 isoform X2 n=1 Tax=Saccostrea echinata TaxID=191078 RepID=UPI002A807ED7|nr:uncharacterized protein LOC133205769 isoform X2 [Saccostrea echinata]
MDGKYLETAKLKESFLECTVCNLNFDDQDHVPRLLNCLHAFCSSCLEKIVKDEKITCPYCQKVHSAKGNDVTNFPKDLTRRDLMDFVRASSQETPIICGLCDENKVATHRCKECQGCFICEECFRNHQKMKTFKDHSPLALKDLPQDTISGLEHFSHEEMCPEVGHGEALKMYCSDPCGKPICTLCACTTHKEHQNYSISEVYKEESESIQDISKEVGKKIESSEKLIEAVDREIVCLPEKAEEQKEAVRAQFANAISLLERRRDELCKTMDEHEERNVKLLEVQKEEIKKYKESCIEAIHFLQTSLAHKNKPAFLRLAPTIRSRFQELEKTPLDVEPHAKAGCVNFEKFSLKKFSDTVTGLGRALCTYVYTPKSSIWVSSKKFEVGVENEFKIELKSVNEIPIDNEDVVLVLESEDGKDVHVSCKYEDNMKKYVGKWCPDEAREFGLKILCNGVPHDFQLKKINVGNASLPSETKTESQTAPKEKESKKAKSIGKLLTGIDSQTAGECKICLDICQIPKQLPCKHNFCKRCIDPYMKTKQKCPFCEKVYGKIYGDQPKGRIMFQREKRSLPGYEGHGTIIVSYIIDAEKQGREHPHPGRQLAGRLERSAFLPDNKDGRLIAKLLNIAFSRRLIFTVDKSQTTGEEDALVWNDIHHKTRRDGGPEEHGYPDGSYLKRVFEELQIKGVTQESADDTSEFKEYSAVFQSH